MKQTVWGHPNGSHFERRVYITVSLLLWYAVLVFHLPVSGFTFQLPEWARFIAMLGFLLGVMAFFEGATFANIDGLLGVHGSTMSHSHGPETPLITEGAYSKVRHPMYRAALFAGVCSVFLHGTAASLLWALMIGATFLLFIPIEERQLVAARGDAYREYCKQTPYRLLRGVW